MAPTPSRAPIARCSSSIRESNTVVFDPVTRGYRFLVPEPARKGIRRAFLNLNSPKIFVNDLLQLRFKDAAQTLGRFVLNTTLGLGGLFDAGKAAGWERHDTDFGQTLAKMGVRQRAVPRDPRLRPEHRARRAWEASSTWHSSR